MTWTYVYGLDIETDTSPLTPEELAEGYAPDSRGLDPRIGRITAVAVADAYPTPIVFTGEEDAILRDLDQYFHQAPPGLIATWNGSCFDLPYIADRTEARFAIAGAIGIVLQPDPFITPKYSPLPGHSGGYTAAWLNRTRVPHAHLDVAYAYRTALYNEGVPWTLKDAARAHGFDPVEVDRTKMHLLSAEERSAYVSSDARVTRLLALRLLSPRATR